MALMINSWGDIAIVGGIFPTIVKDIYDHLRPVDQVYFRESREKRLGKSMEQAAANRDAAV